MSFLQNFSNELLGPLKPVNGKGTPIENHGQYVENRATELAPLLSDLSTDPLTYYSEREERGERPDLAAIKAKEPFVSAPPWPKKMKLLKLAAGAINYLPFNETNHSFIYLRATSKNVFIGLGNFNIDAVNTTLTSSSIIEGDWDSPLPVGDFDIFTVPKGVSGIKFMNADAAIQYLLVGLY